MSQESITIEQYRELESKLASVEKELKEYRDFIKELTPLLNCLQDQDALIEAILVGKINNDLARIIMGDKIDSNLTEDDNEDEESSDDYGYSAYYDLLHDGDDNEDVHCTYDKDGNEYITSDTDIFGEPYEDWNDSNDRG